MHPCASSAPSVQIKGQTHNLSQLLHDYEVMPPLLLCKAQFTSMQVAAVAGIKAIPTLTTTHRENALLLENTETNRAVIHSE